MHVFFPAKDINVCLLFSVSPCVSDSSKCVSRVCIPKKKKWPSFKPRSRTNSKFGCVLAHPCISYRLPYAQAQRSLAHLTHLWLLILPAAILMSQVHSLASGKHCGHVQSTLCFSLLLSFLRVPVCTRMCPPASQMAITYATCERFTLTPKQLVLLSLW